MRLANTYHEALEVATKCLSERYAMDFRKATKRYAVLGTPEDAAEQLDKFQSAGIRHFALEMVGPAEERDEQIIRFCKEVRPLLSNFG